MGKIVGLDHISINVKSMEETLDYYCNLLGFQLLTHEPAPFGDFALIRLGDCTLELIVQPDPSSVDWDMAGGSPVLNHIGLKVECLDEMFSDLKAKGIQFDDDTIVELSEPMGGLRAVCTKGPNGERLNFYEFANPK